MCRITAPLARELRTRTSDDAYRADPKPGLVSLGIESNGRDDWIRTSDLFHPKEARYRAAPRPVPNTVFSLLDFNG